MVMASVAFLGVVLERTAYKPLRKSARLSAVVSALGASILLQNALMLLYGARFLVFPQDILPSMPISLFGIYVPLVRIIILGISFLMMIGLYLFIQKTRIGTAIRAAAIDQGAAQLMGINVDRVILMVFVLGPALGGAAGLLVGIQYGQVYFTMGWSYGLKAFTAAVLGGIGNIPGAMVGGLLLGVIESLGSAYFSTAWKDALAFLRSDSRAHPASHRAVGRTRGGEGLMLRQTGSSAISRLRCCWPLRRCFSTPTGLTC